MWHYVCNEFEDSFCGCVEAEEEFDEDAAFEEARENRAGFNDGGEGE